MDGIKTRFMDAKNSSDESLHLSTNAKYVHTDSDNSITRMVTI